MQKKQKKPNPDICYIVKEGEHNLDLLFSLRSLYHYCSDFGNVWIFGHKPKWVQCQSREVEQKSGKWRNALNNVIKTCNETAVTEDFVLMNDDFFCTERFSFTRDSLNLCKPVPLLTFFDRIKYARRSAWYDMFRFMIILLKQLCKDHELCDYTLHMPMLINKTKFLEALSLRQVQKYLDKTYENRNNYPHTIDRKTLSFRLLYGNLNYDVNNPPKKVNDQKLRHLKKVSEEELPTESPWISVFDCQLDQDISLRPALLKYLWSLPPCPIEIPERMPQTMKSHILLTCS